MKSKKNLKIVLIFILSIIFFLCYILIHSMGNVKIPVKKSQEIFAENNAEEIELIYNFDLLENFDIFANLDFFENILDESE